MSRDALKDAFIAGYHACENHAPSDIPSDSDIVRKFDAWYTNTLDTLERATPDGWIEWDGSADMPPGLSSDERVDVRLFDGTEDTDKAVRYSWRHSGLPNFPADITRYRVVRS